METNMEPCSQLGGLKTEGPYEVQREGMVRGEGKNHERIMSTKSGEQKYLRRVSSFEKLQSGPT